MLKTISSHIKDLFLIKQILYGCTDWVVVRDLNDVYVNTYLRASNIKKYDVSYEVLIGKTIYEVCDKKVALYYKMCGENSINSDKIFVSKKVYTTIGKEYDGLLYFCPYKDQQNNIIGTISYNINIFFLKKAANVLFNNENVGLKNLYNNLNNSRELFTEILKLIKQIDPRQIINNNNIVLIQHLKKYLNILLNNLKQASKALINNNFSS